MSGAGIRPLILEVLNSVPGDWMDADRIAQQMGPIGYTKRRFLPNTLRDMALDGVINRTRIRRDGPGKNGQRREQWCYQAFAAAPSLDKPLKADPAGEALEKQPRLGLLARIAALEAERDELAQQRGDCIKRVTELTAENQHIMRGRDQLAGLLSDALDEIETLKAGVAAAEARCHELFTVTVSVKKG